MIIFKCLIKLIKCVGYYYLSNFLFSPFQRPLSCTVFAIVAMATICWEANASKIVNVECSAASLAANPVECFIEHAFQYDYGDQMTIDGGLNDTQQANQILEFAVSYDARLQSIPPQLWKQLPNLEHLNLRGVGLQLLHESDFYNAWNLYNLTLGMVFFLLIKNNGNEQL